MKKRKKKSWGTRNVYRGITYRSYWETYLAALLYASDIPFHFEMKRYFLTQDISYLPDFYLPQYRTFIEVKGYLKNLDATRMTLFRMKVQANFIYFGQNEIESIFGDSASKIAKIDFETFRPSIEELDRFHRFLRKHLKEFSKGLNNGKE